MNVHKYARYALSAVFTVVAIAAYFIPEFGEVLTMVLGTGGSAVLGSVIQTGAVSYEDTNTNASGVLERDISKVVTEQRPDEFPLDTLLRSIRPAESAHNVKVEYDTVTYRERGDALGAGFTQAGGAADAEATLTVGKGIWAKNDVVYVPSVTGHDGKALRLIVTERVSATSIKVTAINGQSSGNPTWVPTLANGTAIYRSAPAWHEKLSISDIITQDPSQDFNYCQIKAKVIERTQMESKMKTYSGYSYQDKVRQQIYDLRSDCESAILFGIRGKTTVNSEAVYSQNGLTNIITNTQTFGTGASAVDPSLADILDLCEATFADNAGSYRRLLLAGKKVITGLDKITYDKNVESMGTQILHGISTKGLHSSFGELYIKHSKMMDQNGWDSKAIVIDLDHIYKHDLEPMHTKQLDPDSAGTRRVQDSIRILENSTVTVRYPDTHVIWEPDTST